MSLPHSKYQLDFTQDCIFGQIGLSVSLDSMLLISNAIHNYCRQSVIQDVVIGYDSSKWSRIFAEQVVLPRLLELGLSGYVVDQPVPIWALSWTTNRVWIDSEKSVKPLGIYFGTDSSQEETLSIHFRDHQGVAYTENKVAEIVSQSIKIRETEEAGYTPESEERLSVERYPLYLKNTKLINPDKVRGAVLSIDNMFGATEPLIQAVRSEFLFQGQLVNKSSDRVRYQNYQSLPSGDWLSWKVPAKDHQLRQNANFKIHAAINNDGRYLGIFDLKQGLEISPSGIAMIFLRYLSEVKKRKGTVILSHAVSDKVREAANHYRYKKVLINSGPEHFPAALKEVGLRSALMYCDEFGGFWFKGQVPEPNALISLLYLTEICNHYQLSPGELVDVISKKVLVSKYTYGKLAIPASITPKPRIVEIIQRDCSVVEALHGSTTVIRNSDDSKITLTEDKKTQSTFVTVESFDEGATREIITNLQNKCFNLEEVQGEVITP